LGNSDNFDWNDEAYTYIPYTEMREKLSDLEKIYPRIMKVETSASKLGLPHYAKCGDDE